MSRFQKMFVTMVAGLAAALSGTRQRARSMSIGGPAVSTSVALLSMVSLLRVRSPSCTPMSAATAAAAR